MKKWLVSGAFVVVVIPILVIGNMNWNQKVEETVIEAEVVLEQKQEGKEKEGSNKEKDSDPAISDKEENNESETTASGNGQSPSSQTKTGLVPTEDTETASGTVIISTEETNSTQPASTEENKEAETKQPEEEKEITLEKLSLGKIKDKYFLQFRELERIQNQRLDNLLLEAYNEHEYYQANNIAFSRDEFVKKYRSRAEKLEVEADSSFYQTYENMKKELSYNDFSELEAEPYMNIYETTKEQRRNSLFSILN